MHAWIASAIARESIARGRRGTGRAPGDAQLARLARDHFELWDSSLDPEGGRLEDFSVRTAFEQFSLQEDPFQLSARSIAILEQPLPPKGLREINAMTFGQLFGASPSETVKASLLLGASLGPNGGMFDLAWLDQPGFIPVLERIPRDTFLRVWPRFSTSYGALRVRARSNRASDPDEQRFDFNPIATTPFVELEPGRFWAPSAREVIQRVSMNSTYYLGVEQFGNAFAEDLGLLVELYVGDQIRQLHTRVEHDVEYEKGKRTVDYVVQTADEILLVEVKGARVAVGARTSFDRFVDDANRDVGHAFEQINRAVSVVSSHPRFGHLDRTLPIRGVVVTAEPHHVANSVIARAGMPDPGVPTVALDLGELELAIDLGLAGRPNLWANLANRGSKGSGTVADYLNSERDVIGRRTTNPILDAAWEKVSLDLEN
jgi:hypothetical protein